MTAAHKAFGLIALIILGYLLYSILKPDTYLGFFYPNKNDLTEDVSSPQGFKTLEECRIWIKDVANGRPPASYDYECGKNCDTSNGKPYICEETLQ